MAAPPAAPERSDDSSSSGRSFVADLPASAGKLWDEKVGAATKAVEEQLKSVTGAAEAALDAGISAASDAVRAGAAAAGREGEAVKSRLARFYDTGVAHYEATEQQALEVLKRGVRCVRDDYPQASAAAGVAAFFLLLPGPRRFLFRHTLGRLRSEEAMFRSAEQRFAALAERAEGQQGELAKLQAQLQQAEVEYQRGLAQVKSATGELQSLAGRVRSSSKAAKNLVLDLRELPSKQALQLRSDSANTAAAIAGQSRELDKALKRVARQYGL